MTVTRPPDSRFLPLKAATEAALRATPEGNAEAFAAKTRVGARMLREYCDHRVQLFAPLDVALMLDEASGAPVIARGLADLQGFVLSRKAESDEARAMAAIKETSEAVAAMAQLAPLVTWPHAQAKRTLTEVREAMAALAGLERALAQRVEGGG